jgi:Type ISP C-terminal specificity domain
LEQFETANIRRMMLLPMDVRWCYHTLGPGLWNRARPDYSRQVWSGNGFLVARKRAVADPEGVPFFFTSVIADEHAFLKDAYYVPLMLRHEAPPPAATDGQTDFLDHVAQSAPIQIANLSDTARSYLTTLGITDPDRDMETAALLWQHVLAIGYAPAYLAEHEDGIRADWPRIPLPATEDALRASADLGKQLAVLLDTEQPVPHVTSGVVRPELRVIADLTKLGGTPLNPNAGDFDLRARWGYASTNGIVMGGAGKLTQRPYTEDELAALESGAEALGLTLDQALDRLGRTTCDVFLNDRVYWRNVPTRVWDFTIGGYQVMKKWLSYREYALLNRPLTLNEVQHVVGMARRLAAVRLLEPALDANYAAITADTYPWPAAAT